MGDAVDDEELIKNAVYVLAHYLGIDLEKESHLVWIAEEALDNLPPGWEFGVSDEGEHAGLPYFYNSETEESVWTHPLEDQYRDKVKKERRKAQEKDSRPNSGGGSRPSSSGGANDRGRDKDREGKDRGRDSRDASRDARDRRNVNFSQDDDDRRGRSPQRRDHRDDAGRDRDHDRDDHLPRKAQRGWDDEKLADSHAKARGDVAEVTEIEEIEDFDESFDHGAKRPAVAHQQASNPSQSNQDKKASANASRGFGMSEDDFFDDDGDNDPAAVLLGPRTTLATVPNTNASASSASNASSHTTNAAQASNPLGFQSKFLQGAQTNGAPAANAKAQDKASTQSQAASSAQSNANGSNSNNNSNALATGERWFRLPEEKQTGATAAGGRDANGREGRDRDRDASRDARDRDRSSDAGNRRGRDADRDGRDRERERSRDARERDLRDRDRDHREREAREREQREREHRDRDARERERELRDRELRDREQREREAREDRDRDRDRSLQLLVDDLRHERDLLHDELRDVRHRHHQELAAQREEARSLELKLQEERRLRFQQEENGQREVGELQRRIREFDEAQELTVREALRKQRLQFDDEVADKLRGKERAALDAQDSLRQEIVALKRKLDEQTREHEQLRRKLALSRDDVRAEFLTELDGCQAKLREQEDDQRRLQQEQRHLRDELAAFAQKNGLLSQTIQTQTVELENLRQSQASAAQEVAFQAAAVTHATQRAVQLEQELAQVRAQLTLVSQERDKLQRSVQQAATQQVVTGDASAQLEQELRKQRRAHQAEVQRLSSRVMELEALQHVWQDQTHRAETQDAAQLRTLKFDLLRAEEEKQALADRLGSALLKEDELLARVRQLEKDGLFAQDAAYRRDKQLAEEAARLESLRGAIAALRSEHDAALTVARDKQRAAEEQLQQLQREAAEAKRQWEQELTAKLPKLVASAVEQAQLQWQEEHDAALAAARRQCDQLVQRKEQEIAELHGEARAAAMKERTRKSEEQLESDKLRASLRQLQVALDERDAALLEQKRQLRLFEHLLQEQRLLGAVGGGALTVPASAAARRYATAADDFGAAGDAYDAYDAPAAPGGRLHELLTRSADFSGLVEQSLGAPRPAAFQPTPQPPRAPPAAPPQQPQAPPEDAAAVAMLSHELALMREQLSQVLQSPAVAQSFAATPRPALTHRRVAATPAAVAVAGESERKAAAGDAYAQQLQLQQLNKSVHFEPQPQPQAPPVSTAVSRRAQAALLSDSGAGDDAEVSALLEHIAATLPALPNEPPEELVDDDASLSFNASRLSQRSAARAAAQRPLDAYFPPSYTPVGRGAPASARLPRTGRAAAAAPAARPHEAATDASLLSMSLLSLDSAAQSVDTRRSAPQQTALDFSAISDGGYHPGYWRTKYAKKT